jgi:hypothetical protein
VPSEGYFNGSASIDIGSIEVSSAGELLVVMPAAARDRHATSARPCLHDEADCAGHAAHEHDFGATEMGVDDKLSHAETRRRVSGDTRPRGHVGKLAIRSDGIMRGLRSAACAAPDRSRPLACSAPLQVQE